MTAASRRTTVFIDGSASRDNSPRFQVIAVVADFRHYSR